MAIPVRDGANGRANPLTPQRLTRALARQARKLDQFVCRTLIRRPVRLPRTARMVSFTFDDFPQSAADRGAAILERNDARGTFYACLGLLGKQSPGGVLVDEASLIALAKQGHEIGCHTYTHLDLVKTARRQIVDDLKVNREKATSLGLTLTNFAYPYGKVGAINKGRVRDLYASSRSTNAEIARGVFDAAQLPAISLEPKTDYANLSRYLDDIDKYGGWAIFYSHDVSREPSRGGVTPEQLERLVAETRARGLDIVTVAAATRQFEP